MASQHEQLPRTVALIEQGIADGTQIGAQIYVSRDGRVVTDVGIGESRPGVAMTAGSMLAWFSSTKAVSSVALAQVWERGALDLDDPVTRFIPEFGAGGKEGITVRHLLTHTGGFRDADGGATGRMGYPLPSWDEIITRICAARIEPGWVPGKKAGYHPSSSYYVLGEIVRRLDGRPFDRYVREAIFEPLRMTDCWIGMPPERFRAYGERIGLMQNTEGPQPQPADIVDQADFVAQPMPAGNGRGPIRELGRFYEMMLARGIGGGSPGRRGLGNQTGQVSTGVPG
ncbi:MAG: serine hydrolase domain-containing protein, partial [Dehalococcoidia bacterium]